MTEASKSNLLSLVIGLLVGLAAPYLTLPDWLIWGGIGAAGLVTCLVLGRKAALYCAAGAGGGYVLAIFLKAILPILIDHGYFPSSLCGTIVGTTALIVLAVLAGLAVAIGLQALGQLISQKK